MIFRTLSSSYNTEVILVKIVSILFYTYYCLPLSSLCKTTHRHWIHINVCRVSCGGVFNMLLVLSITFYFHYNIRGCMCSTGPFQYRWLKGYIYSSCYYHHQNGSIHPSHCYHIFPPARYILSSVWVRLSIFFSVIHYTIHYTICGAVCFQFTHPPCDDWENINILSYYHHQIGSMNYYPLFRVRSWNNGVRCMSFYILWNGG